MDYAKLVCQQEVGDPSRGIAKAGRNTPTAESMKPKSVVNGMSGRMAIFARKT
jgi:hypothetical protein